ILFLEWLTQWGHLRLVPLITAQFQALADRAQGCHNVLATFACEPQPAEVERVRERIAEAYGPVIKLTVKVDPALLAGVCIRINDKQVDASLAGRIARLKNELKKPVQPDAVAS
ncbi:MAG: F0F1 ATP synthase subunit delta, partial [bacterium]